MARRDPCPGCGKPKVRYLTKKSARQARRVGSLMDVRPYWCGMYWHLGHTHPAVVAGVVSRSYCYRRPG